MTTRTDSLGGRFVGQATAKRWNKEGQEARSAMWALDENSRRDAFRASKGATRKAALSPTEMLERALAEFKAINPDVWNGINEAYQALVDKKFGNGLDEEETGRMERLGRALDRLMEPYDLARLEFIESRLSGG